MQHQNGGHAECLMPVQGLVYETLTTTDSHATFTAQQPVMIALMSHGRPRRTESVLCQYAGVHGRIPVPIEQSGIPAAAAGSAGKLPS